MRFENSFLDEIRDRVPISSVIGQRVTWDRKKTNASRGDYWACCPFHGEKIAELPLRGQEGPLPLLRLRRFGRPFPVPDRARGMSASPRPSSGSPSWPACRCRRATSRPRTREQERASLTDVMEMATAFFEEQLQAADGAKARAYLRERGLTPATQQAFRLGYAPDSRNALKEHLAAQGRRQGRDRSLRAGAAWRRHPGLLRLVPRPHHVPDPGFARHASSPSAAGRWRPTRWRNT